MPMTPEDAKILEARRASEVRRTEGEPVSSWTDPATGHGYVLFKSRWGADKEKVRFFKSRASRRSFAEEPVKTAHERIGLKKRLFALLAAKKAAKVAPHDLAIGDIILRTWGHTMRSADFFRVTGIPTPRSVVISPIPKIQKDGDWMAGTVIPDEVASPDTGRGMTYKVSMQSGSAELRAENSITRIHRWNGEPISIWSD